jgi:hypothetical protein
LAIAYDDEAGSFRWTDDGPPKATMALARSKAGQD